MATLPNLAFDSVLPANIDAEKTILGAILLATGGLFAAIDSEPPAKHAINLKRDDSTVNRGTIESASFAGVESRHEAPKTSKPFSSIRSSCPR